MTEFTFTRRGLEDHRRWLGISDQFRESLQASYPTREAAIEAMEYGDYVARRDAIRVLGALGDFEAVLHYALVERESSWIPTLACDILVQPPLEILVAWKTWVRVELKLLQLSNSTLTPISGKNGSRVTYRRLNRPKSHSGTVLPGTKNRGQSRI